MAMAARRQWCHGLVRHTLYHAEGVEKDFDWSAHSYRAGAGWKNSTTRTPVPHYTDDVAGPRVWTQPVPVKMRPDRATAHESPCGISAHSITDSSPHLSCLGPDHSLRRLRHRADTFEQEALHAGAGVSLSGVEVALRVGRQVVDTEELAGLPSAITEGRQHIERAAKKDIDFLVYAVRCVDIRLLWISREGHVPHRTGSISLLVDERFLDVRAVLAKDLDAIVHPVAHIHETVVRDDDAVHRAELLRGCRRRIVWGQLEVVGFVPVGAPMPLVLAGVGIEDDDPTVTVPVGDIHF